MFPDLTRDDVFRLETRRLWLRWPRQADTADVTRLAGDRAVAAMTGAVPHPYPAGEAERFVIEARRANAEGARLTMAIAPRAKPATLIGMVAIAADRDGRPFIGYWLGTPHWGDGLATEAVRALIDAYFGYTAGVELTASVRVINPASRRVVEKCGFAAVGSGLQAFPARGGLLPVDHFRLDRRTWEGFKAWSNARSVKGQAETAGSAAALAH